MPYLLQKVEHPGIKWAYLPLNRNYKPLGQMTSERVDYAGYMTTHGVRFARDPALIKAVWVDAPSAGAEMLWLYSDGPTSRLDYFARFERLMSKAVSTIGNSS